MKKFFLGFVIGIVFVGLVLVILGFAAVRMASTLGGERPVTVSDNSALILNLEGAVPEQAPVDIAIPYLQPQPPLTVLDTWKLLRRAAGDTRVKALVLEPRGIDAGWAKLEELRAEIMAFKQSGKPVYAYLRNATMREYYLATAADKIYMAPEDELDVKGLRAELTYYKGTLDKLGVSMEFEHVGKYKDAPDSVHQNVAEPGNAGDHQRDSGSVLRKHGAGHRRGPQAASGRRARRHRSGAVHRQERARQRPGGRADFRGRNARRSSMASSRPDLKKIGARSYSQALRRRTLPAALVSPTSPAMAKSPAAIRARTFPTTASPRSAW